MLSVMEWQLLSLNKILPQRVSPKPRVALRAPLAKVEEKPASTNIQKGRELLSDRIRVCFFTLRKRSVQGVGVRLGCSVQTCPVINVWFLWVADNPALKLLQFFHFEVGFNGVFFQVLEGILFFLPPLPFQKYESKYLEELLFKRCIVSPVKVCGCLSVSWVPRASAQRRGWPWARAAMLVMLTCSALLLKSAPASPAAVWPHCYPHNSVNKVCALFVTASTPCFLSGSLAPFKGLSHLRKCQRTSLVTHWLGIHVPVQGTWVQSLVREDLTCQDN